MQLVYIVGTGSTWQDNELRYSLRSACRYYPHSRVLVVGHRPAWLRGVDHLPAHDVYPTGVANVIHKLSKAVHAGVLDPEVTLMNDDFLFLQPVVRALPTYTRGTLADRVAAMDHNNAYRGLHERCLRQLRAWGIPQPLDYGTHTPMCMEPSRMLNILQRFGGSGSAYPFRTCYGNLHRIPGTHLAKDVKMHRSWSLPSGMPMVSMDDAVVHEPAFQAWVVRRFPEACVYEG
jgi:hypothetical protein